MAMTRLVLALVASTGLLLAGCNGTDSTTTTTTEDAHDHDHAGHAHAEVHSLPEAVTALQEMQGELAEAYAENTPENLKEAEGLFHAEITPVTGQLKTLIAESGLEGDDLDTANNAYEQLMTALTELHPSHGADAEIDPALYEANKASLTEALDSLAKVAESAKAAE